MNFLCYIQGGGEAGGGRRPCPGCLQVELMMDYGSPLKESPSHSSPTVSPRPNLQTAQEQSKPTILSRIHRASRARSGGGGASRARRAEHGGGGRPGGAGKHGRVECQARMPRGEQQVARGRRQGASGRWPAGGVRREQQVASGQARLRAAPVPRTRAAEQANTQQGPGAQRPAN